MYVDGALIVTTVFEDSMNCAYYIEKKVTAAIDEFRIPPGVTPPSRQVRKPQTNKGT